jgi:hypothetical protein
MTDPTTPADHHTHRRAPRPHRLQRTALTGVVRGAATALGTVLVAGLTAWAREHL